MVLEPELLFQLASTNVGCEVINQYWNQHFSLYSRELWYISADESNTRIIDKIKALNSSLYDQITLSDPDQTLIRTDNNEIPENQHFSLKRDREEEKLEENKNDNDFSGDSFFQIKREKKSEKRESTSREDSNSSPTLNLDSAANAYCKGFGH